MNIEFHLAHLRTLLAISDAGSFEAAAQRVGRTQSAVTQQMQKLETLIGAKLFRQVGRRRELTPAGQTLENYAR
jgi:DNA-binding transcriptional LysR family regulator